MTPDEIARINEVYLSIIRLHDEVKELIIACEKTEPDQNANISAIAELRSALDHIMRTHAVLFGIEDEESVVERTGMSAFSYCKSNTEKALGHLYRAGYDAYDIISISLSSKIRRLLTGRSTVALFHVIPDLSDVLDQIEQAEKLIVSAKVQKDVQIFEVEQNQFANYAAANSSLEEIFAKLSKSMKSVVAYEDEKKREGRRGLVKDVVLAVVMLLVGALISYLITISIG